MYSKTKTQGIQNTTAWETSESLTLKNIVSYRKIDVEGYLNTVPLPGAPSLQAVFPMYGVQAHSFTNMDQVTEELQLQGNATNLNWVAGLFYLKEKGSDGSPSNQYSTLETYTSNAYIQNVSKSLFAHADYNLPFAQQWTISAGVRGNHDDRYTLSQFRKSPGLANTRYTCLDGTVVTNSFGGLACPQFTNSASFSKPTYDVSVNYKFHNDTMAYWAHRRGYRSGVVFSRPANLALFAVPTQPEIVTDNELGLKTEFGGENVKARVNAAIYSTDLNNAQRTVTFLDPTGVLASSYVNAAKAKINGAEIDLALLVGTQWSFNASYSLVRPKYESFNDRNSAKAIVDVSDSQFNYAPKHVLTLNARYELPLSSDVGKVALQASYYKQSEFDTNEINTTNCAGGAYPACIDDQFSRLPGYSRVNLRADWTSIMNSKFDLGVFVNNAANKYYFTSAFASMSSLGTVALLPGAPRMFGAQLRYNFE